MSDAEQKAALVRRAFEAMRGGDRDAYGALIAPGLRIEPAAIAPDQEVLVGAEGFERWISRWPALFAEYEVHPERLSVLGDEVVVALHERARSARGGMTIEDHFAHVWTVREGLVVRIRVFDDEDSALAAARERDR